MASVIIEERLELEAPAETVWRHLIDPERIVVCLPGAALESVEDERTFFGTVTVKVGAASVSYRGTVEFTEVDHAGRVLRMVGKGREKGGAGSASMEMESRVEEVRTGSEVSVRAELKISGKIVRFGRGMIEGVAGELMRDFAACLQTRLDEAESPEASSTDFGGPAVGGSGSDAEAARALRLLPLIWRASRSWIGKILGR